MLQIVERVPVLESNLVFVCPKEICSIEGKNDRYEYLCHHLSYSDKSSVDYSNTAIVEPCFIFRTLSTNELVVSEESSKFQFVSFIGDRTPDVSKKYAIGRIKLGGDPIYIVDENLTQLLGTLIHKSLQILSNATWETSGHLFLMNTFPYLSDVITVSSVSRYSVYPVYTIVVKDEYIRNKEFKYIFGKSTKLLPISQLKCDIENEPFNYTDYEREITRALIYTNK